MGPRRVYDARFKGLGLFKACARKNIYDAENAWKRQWPIQPWTHIGLKEGGGMGSGIYMFTPEP